MPITLCRSDRCAPALPDLAAHRGRAGGLGRRRGRAIGENIRATCTINQPIYSEGTVKELGNDAWAKKTNNGEDLIVIATTMSTTTGDFSGKLLLCMSSETVTSILDSINQMLQ